MARKYEYVIRSTNPSEGVWYLNRADEFVTLDRACVYLAQAVARRKAATLQAADETRRYSVQSLLKTSKAEWSGTGSVFGGNGGQV